MGALASLATSRCVTNVAQFWVSRLTSFQLWVPQPITVGDNLLKSEGIAPIPLTTITVECFAYLFLPSSNEISRKKGGHKRCLQCENVSIDAQGSRERALWVGRLPQIVPHGQSVASDIAVSWWVCESPSVSASTTCEFHTVS